MNCANCGAAMRFVAPRNYFACDYCTAFHFPRPDPQAADGVVALGGAAGLNCPTCRRPLTNAAIEGFAVQHCEHCRGVLATNEAFAQFTRIRRGRRRGEPDAPVPIDPRELTRAVDCPGCGQRMETHPYYGPGPVVVDTCAACTLIWLDHGELGVIERAPGRT